MGVLAAKQMGVERIIAMSGHKVRQALAHELGATDIVAERGEEGVARIKDLTKGVGADAVLECVGTGQPRLRNVACNQRRCVHGAGDRLHTSRRPHRLCRRTPWRTVRWEAALHAQRAMLGGPAPVRRFLPDLIDLVLNRRINPGKVFDLTLPIAEVRKVTVPWVSAER